ncbi:MAG: nucleotide sugar dehydrogenase [Pseudomonadota bacterium]
MLPRFQDIHIAVIGLGYVGLPLASYLGRAFPVIAFDIDTNRIEELRNGFDKTNEVTSDELKLSDKLHFSMDEADLADCNFFIVTVPTPVNDAKSPDLTALKSASNTVGQAIKPGSIAVFESTVFPGATEEICVPVIEAQSGLKHNVDFFTGYSPERINPADKVHKLPNIKKVTSGSTPEAADLIDQVYAKVITAGTHKATSIQVAEAAKVIENTQRDLNIALVNELAIIFHRAGIDTSEVLEAAGTKWNFLPFRPGLVGGHCIGVDPFYLTYRAEQLGYHPQVILAGRRINDGMGAYVAEQTVREMIVNDLAVKGADIIILGMTFKENCGDIRNSRVIDVVETLQNYGCNVWVNDPLANAEECQNEYGIKLMDWNDLPKANAIVAAVAHDEYTSMQPSCFVERLNPGGVFSDVKAAYDAAELKASGVNVWRL